MLRLCYALRPEGIEWPMVEGKPSFKLENLTKANGISHADAHDAYADVAATIELAKRVKSAQPALYDYLLNNKGKKEAAKLIDVQNRKPLLHISSKFSSTNGCAGLIAPLAWHPFNKNAVIVYNLAVDPAPMMTMSAEEIRERVFTAQVDLPEGEERLPIKLVHLNKCPVLAIPKLLDSSSAQRLHIDKDKCEAHWQKLLKMDVQKKLEDMYRLDNFVGDGDPERMLYDGFISDKDKTVMRELAKANSAALTTRNFVFEDARLNGMLLRYKARNFPESLNAQESSEWKEFVSERLQNGGVKRLSLVELAARIEQLRQEKADDTKAIALLSMLQAYANELKTKYLQ
jgi:exodeoxyribonuclease-1